MSSKLIALISAALLALAQLTNFALFDEEGNRGLKVNPDINCVPRLAPSTAWKLGPEPFDPSITCAKSNFYFTPRSNETFGFLDVRADADQRT